MAEMQIQGGRVKAGLDAQAPAAGQALAQLIFTNDLIGTALQLLECRFHTAHQWFSPASS
jgi:hypothetical protein